MARHPGERVSGDCPRKNKSRPRHNAYPYILAAIIGQVSHELYPPSRSCQALFLELEDSDDGTQVHD